jgi:hypothetical protein
MVTNGYRLGAMRRAGPWTIVAATALAVSPPGGPADLTSLLARIGARVEQYYARAQSIVCVETVRLQSLALDLASADGRARQLVYELRVSWDPPADDSKPPDAKVLRELVKVDGHAPKPGAEPGCMDPKPVSTEPLAMLLQARQSEYAFSWRGTGRLDRRASVMLDYQATTPGTAGISWNGECVSVELPGRNRGRIWVDADSGDVLRLDEQLIGMFEFRVPPQHTPPGRSMWMVIERADSTIRYQPVTFHDPDETLLLPSSIQTLTVIRNSGAPRVRMTQTFSNYKRFITGGRIVKPGAR